MGHALWSDSRAEKRGAPQHLTSFGGHEDHSFFGGFLMRAVTGIAIFGIRFGVLVLAVYWTALFVGTHLPAGLVPSGGVSDKSKHFLAFAILTLLLLHVTQPESNGSKRHGIGDKEKPRPRFRYFWILAGVAIYAIFDEFTQGLIPGRVPDKMDFLADMCGVLVAITLDFGILSRIRRRTKDPEIMSGSR